MSSARSNPEGSSPTGGGSVKDMPVECLSLFPSDGVVVLYDRRRPRNHQVTTPAIRATTGITNSISILVPSPRPLFSVSFWEIEVGEGVGAEFDGVVFVVETVEVVEEVNVDAAVVFWVLDGGDEMIVDRDFVETRKLE